MKTLLKIGLLFAAYTVLAVLTAPTTYAASRQVYTDTIGMNQTDWEGALSFPKFDPAIGILTGVEFQLDGRLQGKAEFESLDAQSAVVTIGMAANVDLQRPDGSAILKAVPLTSVDAAVSPYDGQIDFGGASGRSFPFLVAIDIAQGERLTSPTDLALFAGEGTLELPIRAIGLANGEGAGNLALNYLTQVSAHVTVTYLYEAAAIAMEKFTNGVDADDPPGLLLTVGDPVTWTYVVTNVGAIDLVDITLVDDMEGPIDCPSSQLAAGASMICTLVSAAGAQPGQYTNVATVTARTPDDGVNLPRTVSATDPSSYVATLLAHCPLDTEGRAVLPSVLFLGARAGVFVLPEGYETFVVKRRATVGLPFAFENDAGTVLPDGRRVYDNRGMDGSWRQRIWACAGDCNFVAHLDGPVELGFIDAGITIGAAVIDDDVDDRINKWIGEVDGEFTEIPIEEQTMAQFLTFEAPFAANWSYFAVDSVGIVHICVAYNGVQWAVAGASQNAATADQTSRIQLLLPAIMNNRR
ncbi:MAG: choice-of-anchor E domain-containing protein [Caldilineaceae bacterium]|nr:choice-of-anchor E domain-containing protein [Caldilineaceae bacterium]